ncbi:general stress protein [Nonlabens spongiae]|uniref:General stress protein n=1 Tax=Nonlabens spongiae TaxID=331648 RepID=A0A1W6MHK8_9FLAO|nr:pyridoxamine 5'-phosphate oxidase family protein [Nonlabens spongiae]ARN77081.1 general stress protein [Nonlabens spongiae]
MSEENLHQRRAHEKYLEMARGIPVAMMLTGLRQKPVHSIPMTPKRVQDDGEILFISNSTSENNANLLSDSDCQLIFGDVRSKEFMNVYGSAYISSDQELIDDLWSNLDNNWFEGKNDPSITVIRFRPRYGNYWDTKTNALVTMAKLGYTAITGNETEIGVKGTLQFNYQKN